LTGRFAADFLFNASPFFVRKPLTMHPNQTTLNNFYQAFSRLDAEGMAACYADDVQFEDEAFSLRGKAEVAGMWRMLCAATEAGNRADWRLDWGDVEADATTGQARWEAHYRFAATRRMVHNRVLARFHFDAEGRIVTHQDRFNFWRWSWMALGVPGGVLGWSPMFRKQVRKQARANLDRFLASKATAETA
jgi:ketosteroid isomerase-like protein